MPKSKLRLLTWNIANFSAKKNTHAFSEYLTQTLNYLGADFVGVQEVMSFAGETIGEQLGGKLLNFGQWLYQDSDQYLAHSEQYLMFWQAKGLTQTGEVSNFGGVEFPDANFRPPFVGKFDIKGTNIKNIPIAVYHAPGPQTKETVFKACANLAKIKELQSGGFIMGDFNTTPSDPTKKPGSVSFGGLMQLKYTQGIVNKATSLTTWDHVTDNATYNDVVSSQYDNVFYLLPSGGGTVSCQVIDLISPAVDGGAVQDKDYTALFLAYYGSTTKWQKDKKWSKIKFSSFAEAFRAYRLTVSDHLPVLAEWTLP